MAGFKGGGASLDFRIRHTHAHLHFGENYKIVYALVSLYNKKKKTY